MRRENTIRELCVKKIEIEDSIKGILDGKKIIIYGGGNIGRQILNILRKEKLNIFAFVDKRADRIQCIEKIPVYYPEEMSGTLSNYTVIISVFLEKPQYDELVAGLKGIGFCQFVNGYDILTKDMFRHEDRRILKQKECIEKIVQAYLLLQDEESQDIFYQNLEAHLYNDYSKANYNKGLVQYFSPGLILKKGHKRFVDCGAYIGDTVEKAVEYGPIEEYYGFEPDAYNFEELSLTMDKVVNHVQSAILFPCACSSTNGYQFFAERGSGNSSLSEKGTVRVQTVRLDDVLKKVLPTMIKMDIEGAELDALEGSQRIIKECTPDLAICVYHKLTDLWDIILFLHKLVPEYQFYLRCHFGFTLETVLYATLKDRG